MVCCLTNNSIISDVSDLRGHFSYLKFFYIQYFTKYSTWLARICVMTNIKQGLIKCWHSRHQKNHKFSKSKTPLPGRWGEGSSVFLWRIWNPI